ncbi:MAG: flavin reductase [Myxococcota bacterium]|nr:flavin reductase [Myxococcota bacterium]
MEKRYRARFVNSLSGYKSANLVGTINGHEQTNLAVVSSAFHVGADPALLGMIFRPATVPRHSLENILETGSFTVNQIHSEIVEQAHQTSARYERAESEFSAVGLTPQYSDDFVAPYVQESRLKMGLSLASHQTIDLNQTVLVIGRIIEVLVDEDAVQPDGYIDIGSLDAVSITGLDSYHVGERISRLSYAKTSHPIRRLTVSGTESNG